MNKNELYGEGNQLKTVILKWEFYELKWKERRTHHLGSLSHSYSVAFTYSAFTYA